MQKLNRILCYLRVLLFKIRDELANAWAWRNAGDAPAKGK